MSVLTWVKQKLGSEVEMQQPEKRITCPHCQYEMNDNELYEQLYICPECQKHITIGALDRIRMVIDEDTFEPWFEEIESGNPLQFAGYEEKLISFQEKTGISEAILIGHGKIYGEDAVVGVCDANFLMGSMGQVMGERITRAFEQAVSMRLPVFLFCCSGGARMQEGIMALMQMEKTASAVKRHSDAGLFYCSILTDPTMGGVTASFATLADVILAEPGARIGFAGPRVIQQTIGQTLPDGFQTSEFLLDHGMIDRIVERKDIKETMHYLIRAHKQGGYGTFAVNREEQLKREILQKISNTGQKQDPDGAEWTDRSSQEYFGEKKTAWEKVKICRSSERPTSLDYITRIFDDFREMHGDRYYDDDRALIGGTAFLDGQPVTVLGELRGHTLEECMRRNFGMPMPDGYRKVVRLMKQAEKFHRPVISFIGTPGAFCGVEAEERGQGWAIAESIMEMSALKVPVLCILIGECGSGGALATSVGNQVWMMEHATYAIVSPEGYSSILWKTEERAEEAASTMRMTAQDLAGLQIIDRIIPEMGVAGEHNMDQIAAYLKSGIREYLNASADMTGEELVDERYRRFRRY